MPQPYARVVCEPKWDGIGEIHHEPGDAVEAGIRIAVKHPKRKKRSPKGIQAGQTGRARRRRRD